MPIPRRYWDSSVFLAWLLPEENRLDACRGVVRAAEKGHVQIVTSALTLTEVIKLKGHPQLPKKSHDRKLRRFFQHEYIVIRGVDRFVAEQARELIWKHGAKPKDSIHLATAVRWKIPTLDTFDDKDMTALDGKLGNPLIKIGHPHEPEELELPFGSTQGGDEDDEPNDGSKDEADEG